MAIQKTPIITSLLLLLILGVFCWSVNIAIEQTRLRSWPESSATIIEFDDGISGSSGGQSWYANPTIRFAYEIDGEHIESNWLNPSPMNYQNLPRLRADTKGFQNGLVVKCWYNPNNPKVAYVVNRGGTMDIWIVTIITGFITLNAVRVFVSRHVCRPGHTVI